MRKRLQPRKDNPKRRPQNRKLQTDEKEKPQYFRRRDNQPCAQKKNGHDVTVYLEGRIDTSNAADLGKELEAVRAENDGCDLELDAGALEYISSAGLRVLLQLTKSQEKPLAVINVTPAVYEILEMTGFTELLRVKKAYRKINVDGCEVIGRG